MSYKLDGAHEYGVKARIEPNFNNREEILLDFGVSHSAIEHRPGPSLHDLVCEVVDQPLELFLPAQRVRVDKGKHDFQSIFHKRADLGLDGRLKLELFHREEIVVAHLVKDLWR